VATSQSNQDTIAVELVLPSEPLRHLISGYFISDSTGHAPIVDYSVPEWASLRVMCRGSVSITLQDGGDAVMDQCFFQGPTNRSFRFTLGDCRLLGIGLFPAALARFWDVDVSKLANKVFPLADVIGATSAEFSDGVKKRDTPDAIFAFVDQYFLNLLDTTANNQAVQLSLALHRHINDPGITRIEDLAAAMNLSQSTLTKLCKRRFGFPPKQLLRRQRFLRMLEALHARPYAEWPEFVDPQYSDQSHMIRDFKQVMGLSPSQYLAMPRAIQKASAALRTKTMGRALQGLE
jgi:AraC-like DNA-binding protein